MTDLVDDMILSEWDAKIRAVDLAPHGHVESRRAQLKTFVHRELRQEVETKRKHAA